jgi:integrase
MATRSRTARRGRHRARGPLIQERWSARTRLVYLYGDFRQYADVGGKVEPLSPPGTRRATSDPAIAARLYADRVERYLELRAQAARSISASIADSAARQASELVTATAAKSQGQRIRLSAMIEVHLTRKALPRSGKRASTVREDGKCLAVVRRIIGDPFVDEITPQSCDAFVLTREREPGVRRGTTIAARTIINELHSLSNLMKRAIAMGYIAENPVRRMAEKPAVPQTEAEFLTTEEAARLLDAAAELDDEARRAVYAGRLRCEARKAGDARRRGRARELRAQAREVVGPQGLKHPNVGRHYTNLEVIIATMLYTGGRLSEVLGLRVSDADLNTRRIWFLPTAQRLLKRERHKRDVPLWPDLEIVLREYIARTGVKDGLLFPGRRGMLVSMAKALRRCVRRAGLLADRRVTAHTLRHTFATKLLQTLVRTESGQLAVRSSFDVAKRLGHRSSALVDEVYGHLVPHPQYSESLSYEATRRYPAMRLAGSVEL